MKPPKLCNPRNHATWRSVAPKLFELIARRSARGGLHHHPPPSSYALCPASPPPPSAGETPDTDHFRCLAFTNDCRRVTQNLSGIILQVRLKAALRWLAAALTVEVELEKNGEGGVHAAHQEKNQERLLVIQLHR